MQLVSMYNNTMYTVSIAWNVFLCSSEFARHITQIIWQTQWHTPNTTTASVCYMYIEKPLYTWIRAVGRSLCSHCCFGQINRRTWCPIRSPGNWCSLDRSCREWGKYRRGWMCQLQKRKMNGGCTVDTVFYNPYMHRFRLKELTWAITGGSTVARVAVTAVTIHVIHTRAVDARATAALIYVSCQSESVNSVQHRNIIT